MKNNITVFEIRMGNKIKWTDLYENEQDLIQSLREVNIEKYVKGRYKGQDYVRSFQERLNKGFDLSEKQITQLKRNSKEICLYHLEEEEKKNRFSHLQ